MANMTFWNNVNSLIKNQRITQETVCNETGISLNTLRGWISKDVFPRADEALKIAKSLHTSVEYLITGFEPEIDTKSVIRKYLQEQLEVLK